MSPMRLHRPNCPPHTAKTLGRLPAGVCGASEEAPRTRRGSRRFGGLRGGDFDLNIVCVSISIRNLNRECLFRRRMRSMCRSSGSRRGSRKVSVGRQRVGLLHSRIHSHEIPLRCRRMRSMCRSSRSRRGSRGCRWRCACAIESFPFKVYHHPWQQRIAVDLPQAYAEHVQEFKDSAGLKEVSVGYVVAGALGGGPKSPLYGLLKRGALDEKEQKKLAKCSQVRPKRSRRMEVHGTFSSEEKHKSDARGLGGRWSARLLNARACGGDIRPGRLASGRCAPFRPEQTLKACDVRSASGCVLCTTHREGAQEGMPRACSRAIAVIWK